MYTLQCGKYEQHMLNLSDIQEVGSKLTGKDKDTTETGLKRSRSSSLATALGAQRIPLGPGKAPAAQAVAPIVQQTRATATRRSIAPLRPTQRISVHQDPVVVIQDDPKIESDEMEVEEIKQTTEMIVIEPEPKLSQQEVEAMVDDDDDFDEELEAEAAAFDEPRGPRIWPELGTERAHRFQSEVDRIRDAFRDEVDPLDTTMVSEYAEEIFEYMQELEVCLRFRLSSGDILTPPSGGLHAQPRLHGRAKRD